MYVCMFVCKHVCMYVWLYVYDQNLVTILWFHLFGFAHSCKYLWPGCIGGDRAKFCGTYPLSRILYLDNAWFYAFRSGLVYVCV